jgi:type I restriction enzyme S subunit
MSAIQQLLTDHIDIWTAADVEKKSGRGRSSGNTATAYGIKKLRELILELAVRGKLVPQDANDEPASELLKRIQAEKAKLLAEGKIKKGKPLPPITEDERPFELPQGWNLERLGNLAHLITKGTTPTSLGFTYQNTGIRFVKVENVSVGRINIESIDQYISEEADKALSRSRLMASDVLFSIAGTIGRTCIIHPEDIPANTNQAFAIIRGTKTVFDQMFLLRQLDSFVSNKTKERARGGAMYNVSLSDLADLVLIIPPLAEQHRIVAKVDELMVLCDQLEIQHGNATEAHEKLVSHLLGTLMQSQSAEDFSANWQRIAAHFDTLFTTEASIDVLKQTLLQLAVMGKLVPQDPNDEPASELLKRIQAEKAKLIAEGKIKKDKPLVEIAENEKPFELPEGWEWARMINCAKQITDGEHLTPQRTTDVTKIPLVTAKNVRDGNMDYTSTDYVDFDVAEKCWNRCKPELNDILIVSVGATIGRLTIIDDHRDMVIVRSVTLVKPLLINIPYLALSLRSPFLQKIIWSGVRQNAQPCLYLSVSNSLPIPLPPFAEQHRIVAKVDELMVLCDALKTRINEAQSIQTHLADAIVNQAVA